MTLQGGAGSPWEPGGQGPSPPVPSGLPPLSPTGEVAPLTSQSPTWPRRRGLRHCTKKSASLSFLPPSLSGACHHGQDKPGTFFQAS